MAAQVLEANPFSFWNRAPTTLGASWPRRRKCHYNLLANPGCWHFGCSGLVGALGCIPPPMPAALLLPTQNPAKGTGRRRVLARGPIHEALLSQLAAYSSRPGHCQALPPQWKRCLDTAARRYNGSGYWAWTMTERFYLDQRHLAAAAARTAMGARAMAPGRQRVSVVARHVGPHCTKANGVPAAAAAPEAAASVPAPTPTSFHTRHLVFPADDTSGGRATAEPRRMGMGPRTLCGLLLATSS